MEGKIKTQEEYEKEIDRLLNYYIYIGIIEDKDAKKLINELEIEFPKKFDNISFDERLTIIEKSLVVSVNSIERHKLETGYK